MARTPLVTDWSDPDSYVLQGDIESEDSAVARSNSCILTVVKWVFTAILLVLILVSSVLSKTSFARIASSLANITRENGEITRKDKHSVAFVQLVFILIVPQILTILKAFFLGILGKGTKRFPWPSTSAIIKGAAVAGFESVALSGFVMLVATQLDPGTTILLLSGVFAFTGCHGICRYRESTYFSCCTQESDVRGRSDHNDDVLATHSKWACWVTFQRILDHQVVKFLGLLFQVLGLLGASIAAVVMNKETANIDQIYISAALIPVTCLGLSFLWSHFVQTSIFKSNNQSPLTGLYSRGADGRPAYPASYKGGFLYALVRLVFIPFLCYGGARAIGIEPDIVKGFTVWDSQDFAVFFVQIGTSVLTVILALFALWSTFQFWCFALPLMLSTPFAVAWFWISREKHLFPFFQIDTELYLFNVNAPGLNAYFVIPLSLVFVGMFLSLGTLSWRKPKVPVAREKTLLLSPYYDGVFLDSFLLLNRHSGQLAYRFTSSTASVSKKSRAGTVFICSTMFREEEHEMQQMLESIYKVADALSTSMVSGQETTAKFESHIFFDGALSDDQFREFALQLLGLLEKSLNISLDTVRKFKTPYGYQLNWKVADTLPFFIHLKDNSKVKNKKRWSQVMYMSYILKHRMKESGCSAHDAYILTTDADIRFTSESVAALLDFLVRDDSVGAVCARTHPLGSGPLVWYQIFEYAFGHWFQKSAEHVLGCVLCCPGCFSVFRVSAIADVLDTYQSSVTTASEFLTKDMGEDRWLCTLLIEKGWRLEYAALSENSTFCPDNFNEFFNQRRRWVPSTVANLLQLITSARSITSGNDSVSYLFIFYQFVIIFSTAITPATVILVISSGLNTTTLSINTNWSVAILSIISLIYVMVCLTLPEKLQLNIGKVFALLLGIAIAIAFVGIGVDAIDTVFRLGLYIHNNSDPRAASLTTSLPIDAMYLAGFALIVIIAGFLHFNEFGVLIHFVWYILGLPAGYLLLIIYSASNLHNRSWGTRVGVTQSSGDNNNKIISCYHKFVAMVMDIWSRFLSCIRRKKSSTPTAPPTPDPPPPPSDPDIPPKPRAEVIQPDMSEDLRQWLVDLECEEFIENFFEHGYTRFEFLQGMTIKDLDAIGIHRRGYQLRLYRAIQAKPIKWQENRIPANVSDFLNSLHLGQYTELFRKEGYFVAVDVENLIGLTEKDLKLMGITKRAHLRQLMIGLKHLHRPTARDNDIRTAKGKINAAEYVNIGEIRSEEETFWKGMVKGVLRPESVQLDGNTDLLKEKLKELRNHTVLALVFINVMWLALLLLIQNTVLQEFLLLGDSLLSALFLIVYFLIIAIQFLSLLIHRMETFLHVLARTNTPQKVKGDWFRPGVEVTAQRVSRNYSSRNNIVSSPV
jgi:chitin synthase